MTRTRHFLAFTGLLTAMICVSCGMLFQGQEAHGQSPSLPSSGTPAPAPAQGTPLFGFSTFPFDISAKGMDNLYKLGQEHGQIYVVQRDNGIPWKEALADKPLPAKVMNDWAEFLRRKPAGRPFYLSIAPLNFDRKELADACEGSSMPAQIKGAAFDSDAVKTAYLNYCRAAVKYFNPDFLNIGVEAGELSQRKPSAWPAFARLIDYTRTNLKKDYPNLKIGISFGLQSLMEPAAANRAKALVESCDYLGLSFYPYMSNFHEKFGDTPLPPPPDEWLKPLAWVRAYTTKPIAMCETGYNTSDIALPANKIALKGAVDWQKRYVEDLTRIATQDNYLFVIWYFPVDLDRFFDTLPDHGGAAVLWEKNGMLDKDLNPKPAWDVWNNAIQGKLAAGGASSPAPASAQPGAKPALANIGFAADGDLFAVPSGAKALLSASGGPDSKGAMEWQFTYAKKDWAWASRKFGAGKLKGATQMSVWVKSNQTGAVVVQFKESDGEVWSTQISPTSDWAQVSVPLSSLACDGSHKKNGKFEAQKVVEIVLADGGATEGKTGQRSIFFSQWDFQ